MPLRRITKFCTATCRASGERCKNPAAHQMSTCRSHGARPQSTVLRGEDNPNYKHGLTTLNAKAAYKASRSTFKEIARLGRHAGLYEGTPSADVDGNDGGESATTTRQTAGSRYGVK